MNKLKLVALALCWSIACKQEPADFNDCILQSVKPGMSERAVQLLTRACRQKFPEGESHQALPDLPEEARVKLTGHFGPSTGSTWSGNIYNSNEDWTVEEVTLLIELPSGDGFDGQATDAAAPASTEPERYRVSVRVPPLSNAEFSLSVNWSSEQAYTWSIVSARGRNQ